MAERIGAVIKFKAGISRDEAAEILRGIAASIETESFKMVTTRFATDGQARVDYVPTNDVRNLLHTYNPEHGGPVWYVP